MPTMNPLTNDVLVALLTFNLGEQQYALPVSDVVEVAAMVEIAKVIDAPLVVVGMTNRHGKVMTMLDLRLIFGQPAVPISASSLFVVVEHQGLLAGLIVDEINEVEYFDVGSLTIVQTPGKYIRGMISTEESLLQIVAIPAIYDAFLPTQAHEG